MYTIACPRCTTTTDVVSISPSVAVFCSNGACGFADYADKWFLTAYPPSAPPSNCATKYCPKCYARKDYAVNLSSNMLTCVHCCYVDNEYFWLATPPVPSNPQPLGQLKYVTKKELAALYPAKTTCAAPACEIVHVTLMHCEYDYCRTHKVEVDKGSTFPPSFL